MTPSEQQQIRALNDVLESEINIRLVENTHGTSAEMAKFCRELANLVPRIRLSRKKDDQRQVPVIGITDSITYSGVPAGTEFSPFVELLTALGNAKPGSPTGVDPRLAAVTAPAILTLYVSSVCPHCPDMFRQIYPLCLANDNLKLTIVDGPAFPELAEADNIKSVPTLILDSQFRWSATIDVDELLRIIGSRNLAELGVDSLKGMIQDGNAYGLSAMMLSENKIFPAFIELLIHPEFSVRLGAMAAIEDVAEQERSVAGQVVAPLMECFQQLDDQVKGDVLYVIGECGDANAGSFLRSVSAATQNNELREAAEDALEAMDLRM